MMLETFNNITVNIYDDNCANIIVHKVKEWRIIGSRANLDDDYPNGGIIYDPDEFTKWIIEAIDPDTGPYISIGDTLNNKWEISEIIKCEKYKTDDLIIYINTKIYEP